MRHGLVTIIPACSRRFGLLFQTEFRSQLDTGAEEAILDGRYAEDLGTGILAFIMGKSMGRCVMRLAGSFRACRNFSANKSAKRVGYGREDLWSLV